MASKKRSRGGGNRRKTVDSNNGGSEATSDQITFLTLEDVKCEICLGFMVSYLPWLL